MNLLRELARCRMAHRLQCDDGPDMTGANQAALEAAQLSREQLAWVQNIYAQEAPARAEARAKATQVADAQLGQMALQDQLTRESADHYRTTFKPIETRIAQEAMNYDTAARREQVAGQRVADVGTQADISREGMMRDLASRGVDTSSGNAVSALARGGIMEAAAKAAAANAGRQEVETVGRALRADAANLGRGIASAQGTTASLATQAGNSAVGNSQTALNTGMSGVGMVQQGQQMGINGITGAANTLTNIGKVQSDSGGNAMQMIGTVAGAGLSKWMTGGLG